jgi:hypothetical protein
MYTNTIDYYKKNPKIPPATLVLKYICKFSNFIMCIILSNNDIPYIQNFQCLLDF